MKILISPAKTLDWQSPISAHEFSTPAFIPQAKKLISVLKKLPAEDLSKLMDISPALSALNVERYRQWKETHDLGEARPAMYAFDGDVYTGLDAFTLDESAVKYAQDNLRILSGLYGVLKPLDLIRPYRLEMGTALETNKGKHLYDFWGDTVTNFLQSELQAGEVVINLASEEYFKVIQPRRLKARIIQPVFYDFKNGQYKIISFFAKKARGLMARYICRYQPSVPEDLLAFNEDGYAFSDPMSSESKWVFVRG